MNDAKRRPDMPVMPVMPGIQKNDYKGNEVSIAAGGG